MNSFVPSMRRARPFAALLIAAGVWLAAPQAHAQAKTLRFVAHAEAKKRSVFA